MVDVFVPVMRRPQNAAPFMHSLTCTVPDMALVRVVVIHGMDDVETAAAWRQEGAIAIPCPRQPGSFPQRINWGYVATGMLDPSSWMLLAGDDVCFHDGWHQAFTQAAQVNPNAYVIGSNDLGNGAVTSGQTATHMFIRRDYVDEFGASWDGPGVVCHEGYRHCYVDDEIVHAAKQRGVWVHASGCIIEHMHPAWGKAAHDDIYALGGQSMPADGQLFGQRRAQFGA